MQNPSLASFCCLNPACPVHGQPGHETLRVRKRYGPQHRLLLRCTVCGTEFSERKGTALWNLKLPDETVQNIVEHLTHGNSLVQTADLTHTHRSTVRRIAGVCAVHVAQVHHQQARDLKVTSLQADERHGFVGHKDEPCWEATVIDPRSKFLVESRLGPRTTHLAASLLVSARDRLREPHDLVLFTDGWLPYDSLFPEVFGTAWQPKRQGNRGRFPARQYRIPRTLAHVRVVKSYQGKRVTGVRVVRAAGTQHRVELELKRLGYVTSNTSAVERHNATARRMNPYQVRRSLAFARLSWTRQMLTTLSNGVYNFCRTQRGLRVALAEPVGRRQYQQRTPAMAIGLTASVWSVLQLLTTRPLPTPRRS